IRGLSVQHRGAVCSAGADRDSATWTYHRCEIQQMMHVNVARAKIALRLLEIELTCIACSQTWRAAQDAIHTYLAIDRRREATRSAPDSSGRHGSNFDLVAQHDVPHSPRARSARFELPTSWFVVRPS